MYDFKTYLQKLHVTQNVYLIKPNDLHKIKKDCCFEVENCLRPGKNNFWVTLGDLTTNFSAGFSCVLASSFQHKITHIISTVAQHKRCGHKYLCEVHKSLSEPKTHLYFLNTNYYLICITFQATYHSNTMKILRTNSPPANVKIWKGTAEQDNILLFLMYTSEKPK